MLARQVALPGAQEVQDNAADSEFQRINFASLELLRPRTLGVEQVGLWAMQQVQLIPLLKRLG